LCPLPCYPPKLQFTLEISFYTLSSVHHICTKCLRVCLFPWGWSNMYFHLYIYIYKIHLAIFLQGQEQVQSITEWILMSITEWILISLKFQCSSHAPQPEFLLFVKKGLCRIGYLKQDSLLLSLYPQSRVQIPKPTQGVAYNTWRIYQMMKQCLALLWKYRGGDMVVMHMKIMDATLLCTGSSQSYPGIPGE
jgi:hypothetical protein